MNNGDISTESVDIDDLTWREQEVLNLLSERLTNREIAERLHLSESTVKDYVHRNHQQTVCKKPQGGGQAGKRLGLIGWRPGKRG